MINNFKAKPSAGWLWLSGLGVGIIILMIVPLIPIWSETPLWVLIMNISIGGVIGVPFIYISTQIKRIRYEFKSDILVIQMGSLINHSIPYESIQSIKQKNLSVSLWSSMRFPGLALFTVPYVDEGRVNMCATSASRNILLITTENGKFGITPENEETFVKQLMAKVR